MEYPSWQLSLVVAAIGRIRYYHAACVAMWIH
jgi:hypothetical protein